LKGPVHGACERARGSRARRLIELTIHLAPLYLTKSLHSHTSIRTQHAPLLSYTYSISHPRTHSLTHPLASQTLLDSRTPSGANQNSQRIPNSTHPSRPGRHSLSRRHRHACAHTHFSLSRPEHRRGARHRRPSITSSVGTWTESSIGAVAGGQGSFFVLSFLHQAFHLVVDGFLTRCTTLLPRRGGEHLAKGKEPLGFFASPRPSPFKKGTQSQPAGQPERKRGTRARTHSRG
jgi:hypothetical protein